MTTNKDLWNKMLELEKTMVLLLERSTNTKENVDTLKMLVKGDGGGNIGLVRKVDALEGKVKLFTFIVIAVMSSFIGVVVFATVKLFAAHPEIFH